jgi:segregation and condensation protein B
VTTDGSESNPRLDVDAVEPDEAGLSADSSSSGTRPIASSGPVPQWTPLDEDGDARPDQRPRHDDGSDGAVSELADETLGPSDAPRLCDDASDGAIAVSPGQTGTPTDTDPSPEPPYESPEPMPAATDPGESELHEDAGEPSDEPLDESSPLADGSGHGVAGSPDVNGEPGATAVRDLGVDDARFEAASPSRARPTVLAVAQEPGHEDQQAATDRGADATLDDPDRLRAAVEAVLLVLDGPTSSMALAQGLGRPVREVDNALAELRREYHAGGRGLDLREVAGGWRLYTREELAPYVERFLLEGQHARLTQAALETLAVIAYRQPVTRSRVSAIRGVNVDAVMRTLLTRGLVEECGADPETGGGLYRTTSLFLEKMGLNSLVELPSLAPLLPDTSQLDDVGLST